MSCPPMIIYKKILLSYSINNEPQIQSYGHSVSESVSHSDNKTVSSFVSQSVSHSERQSVCQSISQTVSRSVSLLVSQPVSRSASQSRSQLASKSVCQPVITILIFRPSLKSYWNILLRMSKLDKWIYVRIFSHFPPWYLRYSEKLLCAG